MALHNRRKFIQGTATAAGFGLVATSGVGHFADVVAGQSANATRSDKGMRLGLVVGLGNDPEAAIKKVHDLGLPTCQVLAEEINDDLLKRLKLVLDRYGVEATALGTGGPGPLVYDFYDGPLTLGLVPETYRGARIEHLKQFSDYARQLGIPALHTHAGFIPEDPNDRLYRESIEAFKEIVGYCRRNGQTFLYEAGTETPVTLLRAIEDVGLDNQGVNLDTANLILYGKGNPLDALDVIGPWVKGMHAKDGLYPTGTRELGREVPIGQGKVDFPRLIARLKELNYRGAVSIEREISGPQQIEDIRKEKTYLEKLIAS
jgi:L-ribulose-5-phosphate 3-epimerase